jgi:hypothetical protein
MMNIWHHSFNINSHPVKKQKFEIHLNGQSGEKKKNKGESVFISFPARGKYCGMFSICVAEFYNTLVVWKVCWPSFMLT